MKKGEEKIVITKGYIFDIFYEKKQVSRAGGGTMKSKMTRIQPDVRKLQKIEKKLKNHKNQKLMAYFIKLKDRKKGLAPPPRPKN